MICLSKLYSSLPAFLSTTQILPWGRAPTCPCYIRLSQLTSEVQLRGVFSNGLSSGFNFDSILKLFHNFRFSLKEVGRSWFSRNLWNSHNKKTYMVQKSQFFTSTNTRICFFMFQTVCFTQIWSFQESKSLFSGFFCLWNSFLEVQDEPNVACNFG